MTFKVCAEGTSPYVILDEELAAACIGPCNMYADPVAVLSSRLETRSTIAVECHALFADAAWREHESTV